MERVSIVRYSGRENAGVDVEILIRLWLGTSHLRRVRRTQAVSFFTSSSSFLQQTPSQLLQATWHGYRDPAERHVGAQPREAHICIPPASITPTVHWSYKVHAAALHCCATRHCIRARDNHQVFVPFNLSPMFLHRRKQSDAVCKIISMCCADIPTYRIRGVFRKRGNTTVRGFP